jgi:hypothetical protein
MKSKTAKILLIIGIVWIVISFLLSFWILNKSVCTVSNSCHFEWKSAIEDFIIFGVPSWILFVLSAIFEIKARSMKK